MTHAQKPDFISQRNGRVHLNRRGRLFSRLLAAEVRISGSNAGYTMFRGSVKGTGYPLHSPISPLLPLPFVTVCHHISSGLYPSSHAQFIVGILQPPFLLVSLVFWLFLACVVLGIALSLVHVCVHFGTPVLNVVVHVC